MVKNFGYKVLSISLVLIAVVMAIAYSPKAYTPMISATATLNFGSTAAGASTDLTISISGASLNDAVVVGIPNGSIVATGCFTGWVSSSGVVTVRFSNTDVLSALDPASGTFRVLVIKQ